MTQEEWAEMWNAIKEIENAFEFDMQMPVDVIKLIKDKIQSEVGQME